MNSALVLHSFARVFRLALLFRPFASLSGCRGVPSMSVSVFYRFRSSIILQLKMLKRNGREAKREAGRKDRRKKETEPSRIIVVAD